MKIVTLKRVAHTNDGVFGVVILDDGTPFCVSCELPFKNNQPNISSIPAGEYQANIRFSSKFHYKVYELQNVPNREHIEIHIGNSINDINGCIILGDSFGQVMTPSGDLWGILSSRLAYNKFMEKMKNEDSFKLVIMNV